MQSELLDRMPPNDPDAERGVLGSVLLKPDVLDDVGGLLSSEDFYDPRHHTIWGHMRAMYEADRAVDVTLLASRLKQEADFEAAGGMAYLAEVAQSVPYAANAGHYAALVVKASQYRAMIDSSTAMLQAAYAATEEPTDILNQAEAALSAIKVGQQAQGPTPVWDVVREAMEHIDRVQERGQAAGVMTGLRRFDEQIGGLFPEELIILAARPGVGKSALASQISYHNANKGRAVYFASLEMSRTELIIRTMCGESGVDSRRIRAAQLTADDHLRLMEISGKIAELPWTFHDPAELTVYDIRRAARRMKRDGLDLIVVDYLQLIRPDNPKDPRQEQVSLMSRQLKLLSRELKVPVLVLAQLNRETDRNHYPKLSNLRESGAIEQDADVVLFLHRDERGAEESSGDQEPPLLIVAKNRNGITGKIPLEWIASETRYQCPQPPIHEEFAEYA